MIIFHFIFDLILFANFDIVISSGFWWLFARVTALIFIFLVGVSLMISYSRVKDLPRKEIWKKYTKRGLKIFALGLIITAVTYIFFPQGFIVFGILHFIGISIILAVPFLERKKIVAVVGIAIILIGLYLYSLSFNFSWLLWLGLRPENFYTFDYFPILPWFGAILLGMFFGRKFYFEGRRKLKPGPRFTKLFCFLGRHSLLIYLLHQPILIGIVYLVA